MTAHIYNVVNADKETIKTIVTGKKDKTIAFNKLKFAYPDHYIFLRLEYAGTKKI